MLYKQTENEARAVIKKNFSKLEKALKDFSKRMEPGCKAVGFEIFPDHFDIAGHASQEGAGGDMILLFEGSEPAFGEISRLIETLPEAGDDKSLLEFEKMFDGIKAGVFTAIAGIWKNVAGKNPSATAHAWMEDDAKALNLHTGKMESTAKVLRAFASPPEKKKKSTVKYRALSADEKSKLPVLFAEDYQKWTNDRMDDEMEAFFNFTKSTLEAAEPALLPVFKNYMRSNPSPEGLFTDLRLELGADAVPRLYIWTVSEKFRDTHEFSRGDEITLGDPNPFMGWAQVYMGLHTKFLAGGRLGADLSRELSDMNCIWAIQRSIKNAWEAAGGAKWGPPAFMRHQILSNIWIDPKDAMKQYWLAQVKDMAEALGGGKKPAASKSAKAKPAAKSAAKSAKAKPKAAKSAAKKPAKKSPAKTKKK